MEMADNPKLDMTSPREAYGLLEESIVMEKISLSDHVNGFQYTAAKKSDNFVIDMDSFSPGANKDINANSRITLHRSLSKKGAQRGGEKKINPSNFANDRDPIFATSPRGSSMPEKPMVVAVGTTDNSSNSQVHHQITITTGNIIPTPDSRSFIRRNSIKRSSSASWVLDPKRVLLLFATLSSMGTILLIYFTLSMSKYKADEISLD